MAVWTFTLSAVYAVQHGGFVRSAAASAGTVTTLAGVPVTVTQDGSAVSRVTADSYGTVQFTIDRAAWGTAAPEVIVNLGPKGLHVKADEYGEYLASIATGSSAASIDAHLGGDATDLVPRLNRRALDVRDYGALADGTIDASTAIQAAINAASAAGGGIVFIPPGNYRIDNSLALKSEVSVVGAGMGATRLDCSVTAFYNVMTQSTPLVRARVSDMEIDGTRQALPYDGTIKGIYGTYFSKCVFERLYIHDTGATGMGADYLDECVIDKLVVENCGRLNDGTMPGGSGIGVGVGGGWTVESFTVSNCHAIGNKRYGIFIERQLSPYVASCKVVGCSSETNQVGYGDSGGTRAIWSACYARGNTKAGFAVDAGTFAQSGGAGPALGQYGLFVGCIADGNKVGFLHDSTVLTEVRGYAWRDCLAVGNNEDGFKVLTGSGTVSDLAFTNCESSRNGYAGLYVSGSATVTDLKIRGCDFDNNGTAGSRKWGIHLSANVTRAMITGNSCFDNNTGTQTGGLVLYTGFTATDVMIDGNDFAAVTTPVSVLGTIAGNSRLKNNRGYNPVGTVVNVTIPGAAPLTVTAGPEPRVVYVVGGTGLTIQKNAVTIATASPAMIPLEPGQSVSVTAWSTPPVAVKYEVL